MLHSVSFALTKEISKSRKCICCIYLLQTYTLHPLNVQEKHVTLLQSMFCFLFFFPRRLRDCSVSWLKKWAPGLLECTCWGRWAASSSGQQWSERSGWSSTRLDAACVSSPGPHLTVKEQGCEGLEHWSLCSLWHSVRDHWTGCAMGGMKRTCSNI